jgi:hypothetical protein
VLESQHRTRQMWGQGLGGGAHQGAQQLPPTVGGGWQELGLGRCLVQEGRRERAAPAAGCDEYFPA